MSKQNRLGMYADVKEVLDAALSSSGGSYVCETHGKAIHWRQRAYRFRKLFAETLRPHESSPYDSLVMPRIDDESKTVEIIIRKHVGRFIPNEEPAPDEAHELDDDLLEAAKAISGKIDKDIL